MTNKLLTGLLATCFAIVAVECQAGLILTGIIDGPRAGGLPKAIELFATTDIADLSSYSVANAPNGETAFRTPIALSGSASAGQYLYFASEAPGFTAYFGFAPNFTGGVLNINGDDVVGLFENSVLVDVYGVLGTDGSGTFWDHLDGYAYRVNDTGPSTTFTQSEWTFSGVDALDVQGANGVNGDAGITVPFGTYQNSAVPEPTSIALLSLVGCAGLIARVRRRKVQN